MKTDFLRKIVVSSFVLVPLLSSLISTVHLVDFFYLGNPSWISYTIAISIEIGAIASFLTLSILSKLNKLIVWSMFLILFFMQVVGNVYFSYDWVTEKMKSDPRWILTFQEMLEFFLYEIEEKNAKMILSLLIAVPIPLISVFLLKSTVDYLGSDSPLKEAENTEPENVDVEKPENTNSEDFTESLVEIQENEEKDVDSGIHIKEPRIIGTDPSTGGFKYDS
jgi:hypothetical protein